MTLLSDEPAPGIAYDGLALGARAGCRTASSYAAGRQAARHPILAHDGGQLSVDRGVGCAGVGLAALCARATVSSTESGAAWGAVQGAGLEAYCAACRVSRRSWCPFGAQVRLSRSPLPGSCRMRRRRPFAPNVFTGVPRSWRGALGGSCPVEARHVSTTSGQVGRCDDRSRRPGTPGRGMPSVPGTPSAILVIVQGFNGVSAAARWSTPDIDPSAKSRVQQLII